MNIEKHKPIEVTPHLFQLGTPAFPAYLSMGDEGMIIEGGTSPTFMMMIDQIKTLGIDPDKIKSIVLTHTHPDHIGAVPYFKRIWPNIKVLASPVAAKILGKKELFKQFQLTDLGIAQLMKVKAEIDELADPIDDVSFDIDTIIQEGDSIDLGAGISWKIYEAPGHAPCHIVLLEEKESTLVIGDTTGFYVPEKDSFWPNYFESLEKYCDTIRKLATIPAERALLSHNGVIEGDVRQYLEKAMKAAEAYHNELLQRVEKGESTGEIALDKARFVDNLTDIQPFQIMYDLCKLMIKHSTKTGKEADFTI